MNIHFVVGYLIPIREPELNENFRPDFQLFNTCLSSFQLIKSTSAQNQRNVFERKNQKHQFSFHRPLYLPSDGSIASSPCDTKKKKKKAKPQRKRRVLCCCTTTKPETQQDLERQGFSISNSIDLGLGKNCSLRIYSIPISWCDRMRFCYLHMLQESEKESSRTKKSKQEFAQAVLTKELLTSRHHEPTR